MKPYKKTTMIAQIGERFRKFIFPLLWFELKEIEKEFVKIPLIKKADSKFSNYFFYKHPKVLLVNDNQLDIEFFRNSDNIAAIKVRNQYGKTIYKLKIFTAPTLHVIVNMKNWDAGLYNISISVANTFSIKGDFKLGEASHEETRILVG